MQTGLMRSLTGTSARFGKPKQPLGRLRKTAILISIIPIVFYDIAIGPVMDPILRLLVAVGCTWYAVGIVVLVSWALNRIPASWKASPLMGITTVMVWLLVITRLFTLSFVITDWMALFLQNQGYLSGGVTMLLFLMGFIAFPVLPLLWAIGKVPPASA